MIMTFEQLMKTDLTGYKFSVRSYGVTITSRRGSIDDYFVVVKDDGENCVVENVEFPEYKKQMAKRETAVHVANYPMLYWDSEKKEMFNEIVKP